MLGDTLQTSLLKAKCRDTMQQPCSHRGHCTQPVPHCLPGTVIWMMSSSSGSILICLIPPSSPEVPTRERQQKATANRNQQCHVCPPTQAGKPCLAMTSVPAEHPTATRLQPSGPAASSPWHGGTRRAPVGMASANTSAGRSCWCPQTGCWLSLGAHFLAFLT